MKRATWFVLGGILVGAALIWFVAGQFSSGIVVEVAEARRSAIGEFVDERGKTRLPQTYVITMPYNGRIEPVTLTEGDPVAKSQKVAQIVPEDLQLAVDQAKAMVERLDASITENLDSRLEQIALEQANRFVESMDETVKAVNKQLESSRKKHEYSKKYLERVTKLYRSGNKAVVSEDEFQQAELREVEDRLASDQAERTYWAAVAMQAATRAMPKLIQQYIGDRLLADNVLRKQKAEAEARLRQAELEQNRGAITSPVDGVVLTRCECNERALAAGTPLLEIGRLEDLEIEADVLSVDVVEVKEKAAVEIYGPAIGKGLPDGKDFADGWVHKIYPAGFTKISSLGVEEQRVKVIVHFDAEDLKWLLQHRSFGAGYRVRVRIHTRQKPDALVIPRSALFRDGDGAWNVYAVRGGRVAVQRVEIGILNDELAEVTAGLKEGEQVVRAPESDLAEGQRVQVASKGAQ